ncbi:phosphotransferase [Nocardia sp. NPDC048505]|uniref:aminoglycoside 3'-phosphotransferase n=1 Tax=unclassified Nocardia TaxID=2637762 RepID=UPI0033C7BA14
MTTGYRFDERQRMIPVDPEGLAARVAAAEPADFAGFRQTGIELMLLGRFEAALDHLDRALELAAVDAADGLRSTTQRRVSVWINLADVYRYQGEVATAEVLYRRAMDAARECAPESELLSFAVQHLGKALAEQGRLAEARALLTEAQHRRIAEGDPELIESTRVALETLEQLPIALPAAVRALVGETPVFSDEHEGQSGGVAFVNGRYWMKRGPRAVAEHARLEWLRGKGIRLPDVAAFDADVLLLADAGAPSLAALGDTRTPSVGALMGSVLRRLHSVPIDECPFDGRLDSTLAHARRMVVEGLVDAEDFDDDNRGRTPESVLAQLREQRPAETDLVVAHGDFTSANVLEGGILLDVGALGVADRYRDLALAVRDLGEHHSAGEVAAFFAAYGLTDPDQRRLDYYRLLDELF